MQPKVKAMRRVVIFSLLAFCRLGGGALFCDGNDSICGNKTQPPPPVLSQALVLNRAHVHNAKTAPRKKGRSSKPVVGATDDLTLT